MKKQFVTYEIAEKLKYLGFDSDVIATYHTDDISNKRELNIFAFSVPNRGVFEVGFEKGWAIKAPMWQQATAWLREEHDLFLQVETDCTSYPKFAYKIYSYKESLWNIEANYPELHRTYEQALEEGLKKALELTHTK